MHTITGYSRVQGGFSGTEVGRGGAGSDTSVFYVTERSFSSFQISEFSYRHHLTRETSTLATAIPHTHYALYDDPHVTNPDIKRMVDQSYQALTIAQSISRTPRVRLTDYFSRNDNSVVNTIIITGPTEDVLGLDYGWRRLQAEPPIWHMEHTCRAMHRPYPVFHDRDAVLAEQMRSHILTAFIVSAQQTDSLVDHVNDHRATTHQSATPKPAPQKPAAGGG